MDITQWLIGIGLNSGLGGVALALPKKVLTTAGIIHAWGLGIILWGCLGWRGYVLMLLYLILGSAVTFVGKDIKTAKGIAEKRDGARGPENLWGSAATGAVCAIAYLIIPSPLWLLAYVASIATKLADTTASEIGKAYGKTTILITDFALVPAGTEGAVSLEGTLAGILASCVIAVIAYAIALIDQPIELVWCVLAALIATTAESWIGATWQAKWDWLTNEVVNGINTAIGAIAAVLLSFMATWLWQNYLT
jgi:uncharacterized protein (TIGR00297 family)